LTFSRAEVYKVGIVTEIRLRVKGEIVGGGLTSGKELGLALACHFGHLVVNQFELQLVVVQDCPELEEFAADELAVS